MNTDLSNFICAVENKLRDFLLKENKSATQSGIVLDNPLVDGLYYAVGDGGKRIRPTAVFLGAQACGRIITDVEYDQLVSVACAIELIHSYSLVHDDLPAMDNDDYRRGKLSTHKKYGEANGILIGDELLTLSALLLMQNSSIDDKYLNCAKRIYQSASNMVVGQAYDLGTIDSAKGYLDMYAFKTSALLSMSFEVGAIITCGIDSVESKKMAGYGFHIGQAFQIADDLLDNDEKSFVTFSNKEEATKQLNKQTDDAIACIIDLPNCDLLVDFANVMKNRKK